MKLDGLATLHRNMRGQGIGRCKFRYELNHLAFDCYFFIDTDPYELVMGCIGHNFAIFLDVERGFQIDPFIKPKQTFFDLINALGNTNNSDNKFDCVQFFKEFDQRIPTTANPNNPVTPADVVRYYPDIEDSEKIYFCGWLDNNLQGNQVSAANLYKTKRLMGQEAHDFALRRNLSTKWTHIENQALNHYFPE